MEREFGVGFVKRTEISVIGAPPAMLPLFYCATDITVRDTH